MLQGPSGAAEGPSRAPGREGAGKGRVRTDTQTQAPRPRVPGRTHLGRRLSEQRSVVEPTGAVGPGGKVLHFRVSSLSRSHSKPSQHCLPKSRVYDSQRRRSPSAHSRSPRGPESRRWGWTLRPTGRGRSARAPLPSS